MIEMKNITKVYQVGESRVEALKGIDLSINEGEFVAIMGASGSGKSTLLSIAGCLDIPTSGRYVIDGKDVSLLSDDELSLLRNEKIGFVFQAFHLLPRFNAQENVELPLIYKGTPKDERKERATNCLEQVGLRHRLLHSSSELSGGEQQRVAIARALVNSPRLILADEPTGNLDSTSAEEIMDIFCKLNEEKKMTVVIITHNQAVAERTKRTCHLKDGQIVDEGI
ncbi:ABC transporter ATP-binding protein [bacterium]|nr:ABC transporter ATP-binding protein [bacterium]MBU1754134.1 ABC transporter ATP-binding protein [bacterium]